MNELRETLHISSYEVYNQMLWILQVILQILMLYFLNKPFVGLHHIISDIF